LIASAAGEPFKGHLHRLSRVTAAVSYCYYLVAQTGFSSSVTSCYDLARAFRKGGDYVIQHPNQYCKCCNGGNLREAVLDIHDTSQ
jgi:hypothetical protein